MGRTGKRGYEEVDTYEEDDFVENDDGAARKTKKTKNVQSSSKGVDQDKYWELSTGKNPRRLTVQEFKNNKLISIREYFDKDGEYKPGSKGISLSIEQYRTFLQAIPKLNAHLKAIGIDVSGSAVSDDEPEENSKPKKRVKDKKQKANIEATSDEDEE